MYIKQYTKTQLRKIFNYTDTDVYTFQEPRGAVYYIWRDPKTYYECYIRVTSHECHFLQLSGDTIIIDNNCTLYKDFYSGKGFVYDTNIFSRIFKGADIYFLFEGRILSWYDFIHTIEEMFERENYDMFTESKKLSSNDIKRAKQLSKKHSAQKDPYASVRRETPPPPQVHRDRTKYTRKQKHKNKQWDY